MGTKRQMWMGPRGGERWVTAPDRGPSSTRTGYSTKSEYMNGGAGIRTSRAGHWEYTLSWNAKKRAEVRPIVDMHDGLYDPNPGINPIYFIDPFAADVNLFSQAWAAPFMAGFDAMPLIQGVRPKLVPTDVNPYDYPVRSARYDCTGTPARFYLPIPPGHTLHVGIHGNATGAGAMLMRRITARFPETTSDPVALPMTPVDSASRFTNTVRGDDGNFGVEFFLATSGGTVTIAGMMAEILPDGKLPFAKRFESGQGHSGCAFASRPEESPQSAARDIYGLSAELVEIGAWQ